MFFEGHKQLQQYGQGSFSITKSGSPYKLVFHAVIHTKCRGWRKLLICMFCVDLVLRKRIHGCDSCVVLAAAGWRVDFGARSTLKGNGKFIVVRDVDEASIGSRRALCVADRSDLRTFSRGIRFHMKVNSRPVSCAHLLHQKIPNVRLFRLRISSWAGHNHARNPSFEACHGTSPLMALVAGIFRAPGAGCYLAPVERTYICRSVGFFAAADHSVIHKRFLCER